MLWKQLYQGYNATCLALDDNMVGHTIRPHVSEVVSLSTLGIYFIHLVHLIMLCVVNWFTHFSDTLNFVTWCEMQVLACLRRMHIHAVLFCWMIVRSALETIEFVAACQSLLSHTHLVTKLSTSLILKKLRSPQPKVTPLYHRYQLKTRKLVSLCQTSILFQHPV
jgi:hypothetical protein